MKTKDYLKQATDFLTATGTKFAVKYKGYGLMHWDDKNTYRHIFKCTIKNDRGRYSTLFGQSIEDDDKEPTAYDFLACLSKYDVGTFEDFCSEFGYDEDSRLAEKTYKAVQKEWNALDTMFTEDELEQLREIQ